MVLAHRHIAPHMSAPSCQLDLCLTDVFYNARDMHSPLPTTSDYELLHFLAVRPPQASSWRQLSVLSMPR